MPVFSQRSIEAVYWIYFGSRQLSNVAIGLGAFARLSIVHVPFLTNGVGSNNLKVGTRTQIFMCYTSRNDNNISSLNRKCLPVIIPDGFLVKSGQPSFSYLLGLNHVRVVLRLSAFYRKIVAPPSRTVAEPLDTPSTS